MTDPRSYEIQEITALGGGLIGMAPQPQSTDEFAQIAQYAPQHFVTLTETHEWKMDGFADAARASASHWHHHPVRDFTAANASINPLVDTLTTALSQQGKVFIHCRGGCGRTGMLAMRLLILQGEDPDTALSRLRSVRPCAVEKKSQEFWARFGLNA